MRLISISDISVICSRDKDGFVALRCYFDGANKAEFPHYRSITLCSVMGTKIQWRNLEKRWESLRKRHEFEYIHVTDMLALQGDFKRSEGWSHERVETVLSDCVRTINECTARPEKMQVHGIVSSTCTIVLGDFLGALGKIPNLRTPELHASMHCFQMCCHWADSIKVKSLQLIFDRGEPFRGHVYDRWTSNSNQVEEYAWRHVLSVADARSRDVPGLQVADIIAWSVNKKHEGIVTHSWQEEILSLHNENALLDYKKLYNPDRDAIDSLDRWRIPKRKPFKGAKHGKRKALRK